MDLPAIQSSPWPKLSQADIKRIVGEMGTVDLSTVTIADDFSWVSATMKSDEELAKQADAATTKQMDAMWQAGNAIDAMSSQIAKIQSAVSAQRPDLKSSSWDFSMKDGKLVVSGSQLNAADRKFIEGKLNSNDKLIAAVTSFVGAAVSGLQIADDNLKGTTNGIYGGKMRDSAFDYVAEQLNGAIDFKSFLAKNEDLATDHGQMKIDAVDRGYTALDSIGSRLSSNYKPIGYQVFPTAGTV